MAIGVGTKWPGLTDLTVCGFISGPFARVEFGHLAGALLRFAHASLVCRRVIVTPKSGMLTRTVPRHGNLDG